MSTGPNIAASIMARLQNEAKSLGETFNPLLTRYVGMRMLHRVAQSPHNQEFLVKGATMFLIWTGSMHRPTKDIDLLGLSANDEAELVATFKEICAAPCPEDGVIFAPESVRAARIREEQAYGGIRVTLVGSIGKARIPVQIDVGFGDAVTPGPVGFELPSILKGVPSVHLNGYPVETAVAEKLQAMIVLGRTNSRMKDFFDVAYLADTVEFDEATLHLAIVETFNRRRTPIPRELPLPLSDDYLNDPHVQARWEAFARKNHLAPTYASMPTVVRKVREFIWPLLKLRLPHEPTRLWSNGAWKVTN